MGSPCELKLSGDPALCQQVAADCQREAARFERRYSRFTTDSITAQINASAGGVVVPIDAECRAILEYAGVCWSLSDGLFDITSGVLRRIWTKGRTQLPTPDELNPILALIDWQKVELSEAGVRLGMPGMEIDLGGVVKEYAADALAQRIRSAGIESAVVNLGGDIFCIGANPEGQPWRIGIKNPGGPGAIAQVGIANAGLATSGGYERYLEIEGKRLSHLLNPATGMPVRKSCERQRDCRSKCCCRLDCNHCIAERASRLGWTGFGRWNVIFWQLMPADSFLRVKVRWVMKCPQVAWIKNLHV